MSNIIERCTEFGQPIIEEMGYTLVDVEYVKEGKNHILRYMIDNTNGVDLDEFALISEKISSLLDNLDLIKDEYSLEISSPGAERQLKTKEAVEKAIGQYVNVRLYRPMDNSKEFEGNLIAFAAEILTIEYKAKTTVKTIEIPYAQVSKIRLAIQF